jgi:hypothetical protein
MVISVMNSWLNFPSTASLVTETQWDGLMFNNNIHPCLEPTMKSLGMLWYVVNSQYYTCCCCNLSLNMCMPFAVIETAPQFLFYCLVSSFV